MLTVKMSLRRLMVRRSVVRFGTNNYNSQYNNSNTNPVATSTQVDSFYSFSSFESQRNVGGAIHKFPRSMCYQSCKEQESQGGCDLEQDKIIQKGDVVNLSELLCTQDRGYLSRCNNYQVVMPEQLAGKVVVILFVPLHRDSCFKERNLTKCLSDTYNDLKSKNCFEVVLVVVDDDLTSSDGVFEQPCLDPSLQEKFEYILYGCPSWLVIPFSDFTCRMRIKRKFGIFHRLSEPELFHIDSTGMVLDSSLETLIQTFGAAAYPFEDERVEVLNYKDKEAASVLSLKELLGSSERDFVITNKWDEVPINTLENKVVALFFYEDGFTPDFLARKLKKYYEELKRKNGNFEVVLLYLSDTDQTSLSTNENTFQETFKTMPWLALPFKDPALKKLRRFFGYPDQRPRFVGEPSLVIVGPRRDAIESGPHIIPSKYDNLFMHEEFSKAGEDVRELKFEMLCSPTTVFKRKDGSQVQFSELVGKRVIFLFEGDYPEYDGLNFRENLKESYIHMKGTADDFEVIYLPNNQDKNSERVADVPWLVSCPVDLLSGCSAFLSFYGNNSNRFQSSYLLAFDRDGSLVRRTICPRFYDVKFPFSDDSVETEAFDIAYTNFCWGYWDTLYQGLLRDSKRQKNFPTGDLLCSVYCY